MKTIGIVLSALVALILLSTGCVESPQIEQEVAKPTISEESLGLRKTDIYGEQDTLASQTRYRTSVPGESQPLKRAFQDAPPMIPHTVEGMLPILIDDNQCLSCHLPATAKLVNATAIPKSHFTNFRSGTYIVNGHVMQSGIIVKNTSNESLRDVSIRKQGHLVGARFNCTQCHAPQSQGNAAVENQFQPEYRTEDGDTRSDWRGTQLMEGIDTIKAGN